MRPCYRLFKHATSAGTEKSHKSLPIVSLRAVSHMLTEMIHTESRARDFFRVISKEVKINFNAATCASIRFGVVITVLVRLSCTD